MSEQTDRELLELAAMANWWQELADDEVSFRYSERDDGMLYLHADNQDHNGQDCEFVWNPLTQDHDALRLAVKLGLMVDTSCQPALILCAGPCGIGLEESGRDDPYTATRRAIVRAAAELARSRT